MPRIQPSNILFLIPALIIGPVLLIVLIVHGIVLDRIHVTRRWYRQRAARATARAGSAKMLSASIDAPRGGAAKQSAV